MSNSEKTRQRNDEIVFYYYLIFGNRVHSGLPSSEAKKEAADAVALRYNISPGRLRNIISQQRIARTPNTSSFIVNAHALMDDLAVMNNELEAIRSRNDRLIALLEECIDAAKI